MSKTTVFWILVFAYGALIFGLSSLPSVEIGWGNGEGGWMAINRLFLHFLEFGGLGVLLFLAVYHSFSGLKRSLIYTFSIGALYGITDEIHQFYVPFRVMDLGDMFVDSMGVLAGCLFVILLLKSNKLYRSFKKG